jgi:transposase
LLTLPPSSIQPERISGLSRKKIADDLGGGMSTLNKWIAAHRDTDMVSVEDRELALENERFRRKTRILRDERDIPKQGEIISTIGSRTIVESVLRELKAARFRFVEAHIGAFLTKRPCQVMNVSSRGLRAIRRCPANYTQTWSSCPYQGTIAPET